MELTLSIFDISGIICYTVGKRILLSCVYVRSIIREEVNILHVFSICKYPSHVAYCQVDTGRRLMAISWPINFAKQPGVKRRFIIYKRFFAKVDVIFYTYT